MSYLGVDGERVGGGSSRIRLSGYLSELIGEEASLSMYL